MSDNDLGLRPGDVIVTWSSPLIGFMINAVFGISDPATHAVMVYDDIFNISASTGGVKLRPIEDMYLARKWVVLRNRRVAALPARQVQAAGDKYIGRGYDYFLYILWAMRLSLVLTPLVWLFLQPFRNWLKKEEAQHFGCSELIVCLLNILEVDTGIDEPRNAPPDNLLQTARSCVHDWEVILSGGTMP
jgi:hypothetical protein